MPQSLEAHLAAQSDRSRALFWHRLRWDAVREKLPGGTFSLVDVGAGAGHLGSYLAEAFPLAAYSFIEPIESLRRGLREKWGPAADRGGSPVLTGAGYVALLDVLEHQQDDARFLADLVAKMEPGATLLLTVPALPLLWSQWDEGLGHHRRYTRAMLGAVLAGAHLQVDELSYLFPEMIPLGLYRRVAPPDPGQGFELPEVPPALNGALYALGRLSHRLRRFHVAGTSLFAAARKG